MTASAKAFVRRLLPRRIQPHRIMSGPLRGFLISTSWHDYPAAITGWTERPLLDWFEHSVKPGQTWLDVGAHYGYTAIALARLVGPCGRVFAFEPMLSTAGCVARTRLLNRLSQITVLPVALGAAGALRPVELCTTRGMADSTLGGGGGSDEQVELWRERILVAGFDWLWTQVCGASEQIDGVKVDVQGMELDVLRGMASLLGRWRPKLVVEVHRGVDRSEFLGVIEALGYSRQAVPIEPVSGEFEPQYIDDRSYSFQPS